MNARAPLGWLRSGLLMLGAALLLIGFNYAVWSKTQTLERGAIVKLKLAPVDPRALLTGDYMTLNYEIAAQLRSRTSGAHAVDGFAIVELDEQGVGKLAGLSETLPALNAKQLALQFRQREGQVKFATNAFYFQEGQGKAFEAARYGEFRVNAKGELLLTHLLDEKLVRIKP